VITVGIVVFLVGLNIVFFFFQISKMADSSGLVMPLIEEREDNIDGTSRRKYGEGYSNRREAFFRVKTRLNTFLHTPKIVISIGILVALVALVILVYMLGKRSGTYAQAPEITKSKQEPQSQAMDDVIKIRPHIVFIVADDWGWNDVSWHNNDIVTSNLEHLAKTGVILDKYYTYPTCTPSRAAILTGYYAHRLGLHHRVIEEYQTKHVPTNIPMMAEVLRDEGYATHAVGKWHLGHCSWNYTPTHRGFDSFFGYRFSTEDYYTHIYHGVYEFWQNDKPYIDEANTYSAELFSARAENITKAHALKFGNGKSMYLYLAFQNNHGPQEDPPLQYHINTSFKVSNRRVVTNSANAMDKAVGRVVDILKETGLYKNTVIVFVSDNGGEISNGGNNLPFRGGKFTAWEGGTRVPAFVHSPLLESPGRVHRGLFHVVDWFPTLLNAVGINTNGAKFDGVDMWDTIRTGTPSDTERQNFMYLYDPDQTAAIRVGKYKLILGDPIDSTYERTTSEGSPPHGNANCWLEPNEYFRQLKCDDYNVSDTMLFNIDDDPKEQINLAKIMPDVVEMLKAKIEEEKLRAVDLQDETGHRVEAMKFVRDNVMYPGWC
jgi:arylsulfatase A-like enzyme